MSLPLADVPAAPARAVPAPLAKGFRPFFPGAAAWAVLAVPLWLLVLLGRVAPGDYLPGPFWHAHEMLFGFTLAVVAGFLLTAIGNWTARETAVGWPLAGLAALWAAGRVALLLADHLPRGVPAAIDLAFLPLLLLACARPVVATRNRRNYQFLWMLAGLWAANLAMHLGALGTAPEWLGRGGRVATGLYVVMVLVITGRIVPLFTRNATGAPGIRNLPAADRVAVGSALGVAVLDALGAVADVIAPVAAVAAAAVVVRARHWGARAAARHPLLWILHAGHAWVAAGFGLRALAPVAPAAGMAALHAFTAGALGALTLGMMTRVTLGHTGRPLQAPPVMTAAFAAVLLAGVVRVGGILRGPDAFIGSVLASGTLFALAFASWLAVYARVVVTPRADGRPG